MLAPHGRRSERRSDRGWTLPLFQSPKEKFNRCFKRQRKNINKDPKAETFPEGWAPALVPEVEDAVDKLNTETCLVVMCEAAGLKEDAIMESLTAAAKSMKDVYVEHNDADPQAGQDAATGQGERGDLSAADAG